MSNLEHLYDAAVKTGEYTDNGGNAKGRYVNVGKVMRKEGQAPFLILNRTFNPAGVPNPDDRDTLIVSFFKPGD